MMLMSSEGRASRDWRAFPRHEKRRPGRFLRRTKKKKGWVQENEDNGKRYVKDLEFFNREKKTRSTEQRSAEGNEWGGVDLHRGGGPVQKKKKRTEKKRGLLKWKKKTPRWRIGGSGDQKKQGKQGERNGPQGRESWGRTRLLGGRGKRGENLP